MSNKSIADDHAELKHKWLFLLALALMSAAGLVGSDVYLPAFVQIGEFFNISQHAVQYTLSVYLLGLSIGQLIVGPLTDRYGRKNLLVIGMLVYFIASLSCAFSFSYAQLIISRVAQALGACSGLVIGRAIVGDIYNPQQAGKVFSTIFPFVGMSPAASPVIGGLISHYFNWQMNFIFIALFALAIIILVCTSIKESLPVTARRPLHLGRMLTAYPKLLINTKFLLYVSAPCFAYMAYFAYISQSPFIFHAHGYGVRAIGFLYITLSLTYVCGNLIGRWLLQAWQLDSVLRIGYVLFNIGAVIVLLSASLHLSIAFMVIGISVLTLGNGFLIPLGAAGVVGNFAKSAGYASGLLGFLQLGSAALASSIIGFLSQNSITRLGIYLLVVTLIGTLLHAILYLKGRS